MALVPITIFGSSFTTVETTFLQGFADLTHTQGDIWFVNASGQAARLAAGTSGYVLSSGGAGADPSWVAAGTGGGITELAATETPDGVNNIFTFAAATAQPTYIDVDNVWMKAVTKSGTVNWTWNSGAKQATLSVSPQDEIFGIV